MSTSRPSVPQVNLKDRIAALQQRSLSPAHHDGASSSAHAGPGSLRDKIASFERQGAVPTPRGRFGAGAPPVGDTSSKKRGELYGNRVPELAKPSPDAALAGRRRTISTSDSWSQSRPTSPSSDLPDEPVPPLPTSIAYAGRRIASDVLPRRQPMFDAEKEKEVSSNEPVEADGVEAEVTQTSTPPAILVAAEEVSPAHSSPDTPSPSADDQSSGTTEKPLVVSIDREGADRATESPVNETQTASSPHESTPSVKQSSPVDSSLPSPVPSPTSAVQLVPSTDSDVSSGAEDTATSSDSIPTPSDRSSFHIAESPKDEETKGTISVLGRQVHVVSQVNRQDDVKSADIPAITPEVEITLPQRSVEKNVLTKRADVREDQVPKPDPQVVIVSPEPTKATAPPTVTRTIVVPSPATPPPPSPVPTPPSPFSSDATKERKVTPTFRAVVHRKVRETTPSEPSPVIPKQSSRVPLTQTPVTPTVNRIKSAAIAEPQSPSFGDLAALMADAALLEEHLSGVPPPAKKASPPPTFNVEPAIPEDREMDPVSPVALTISDQHSEVSLDTPDISYAVEEQLLQPSLPVPSNPIPRRVSMPAPRVTQDPPSPPPKERPYSSLRVRKQSIPGEYPRNSLYSEVSSEESTVMVSRPASPPANSDTSSVRSSSKSWKSPRKSIGRASSWLFRSKKNSSVAEEDGDLPSSLLTPYPLTMTRSTNESSTSQIPRRPPSYVSVSSVGSGDIFDPELVNAFPSVPGAPSSGHAPAHRSNTLPPPPVPYLPPSAVNRAHTVAGGRSNGRQQQQTRPL